jgi:hypothetical protein
MSSPIWGLSERSHMSSLYSFWKNRIEITTTKIFSIITCLSVAEETCVNFVATLCFHKPISCYGKVFSQPLSSNGSLCGTPLTANFRLSGVISHYISFRSIATCWNSTRLGLRSCFAMPYYACAVQLHSHQSALDTSHQEMLKRLF